MDKETLSFSVLLSSTNWGKLPQFSIWLDEQQFISNTVDATSTPFTFSAEVTPGVHKLKIVLENKTPADTKLEAGNIVNDMLLNIDDIVIDDISLGHLLWTADYTLDQPQNYNGKTITNLDNCVNLGWNGTYSLSFSSPFYLWLLESL
jgi:hypothetical protein